MQTRCRETDRCLRSRCDRVTGIHRDALSSAAVNCLCSTVTNTDLKRPKLSARRFLVRPTLPFSFSGDDSTDGLILLNQSELERVKGIEPSWPVWKTGALPLSYTRDRRALYRCASGCQLTRQLLVRTLCVFPRCDGPVLRRHALMQGLQLFSECFGSRPGNFPGRCGESRVHPHRIIRLERNDDAIVLHPVSDLHVCERTARPIRAKECPRIRFRLSAWPRVHLPPWCNESLLIRQVFVNAEQFLIRVQRISRRIDEPWRDKEKQDLVRGTIRHRPIRFSLFFDMASRSRTDDKCLSIPHDR
jgi:hypothetical protein